eukprot:4189156-Pyramimonas_sp.AAC.1
MQRCQQFCLGRHRQQRRACRRALQARRQTPAELALKTSGASWAAWSQARLETAKPNPLWR